MEAQFVNCFCTSENNSGNPAVIVQNFKGDCDEKQNLAKELNLPVTVFVSEFHNGYYPIEFYYPAREMPVCVHGTIGAAFILFKGMTAPQLSFITKQGRLLNVRKDKGLIQVRVAKDRIPDISFNKAEIAKILKLSDPNDIIDDLPFRVSSVGSPKLLVPLKSYELLMALKPDFDLLKKWSIKSAVNGLYVYTPKNQNHYDARGFNPKGGHPEDAATGVAAAALSLSLQHDIVVEQGHVIKRPSQMMVSYIDAENIWVGGLIQDKLHL